MTRNRRSARNAGTRFERLIADALAEHVDDRIDRRVKTGNKDRGDIGGVRFSSVPGFTDPKRLVIECKDVARTDLSGWVNEAEIERGNDDALAGFVVHKRRGHGDPLDQYVTCTLRDLVLGRTTSKADLDRRRATQPYTQPTSEADQKVSPGWTPNSFCMVHLRATMWPPLSRTTPFGCPVVPDV